MTTSTQEKCLGLPLPLHIVVLATLVLPLCHIMPCTGALEARPTLLPAVQPRLIVSPSDIKVCVTSAVTLECTTRGRHTLAARIASSSEESDENDNDDDNGSIIKISSIQISKKEDGENEDESWRVFAQLSNSMSPQGSGVRDPRVQIRGNVNGLAKESFLQITWDLATNDTLGVYRCHVTAVMTKDGNQKITESFSTAPVEIAEQKLYSDKAERQKAPDSTKVNREEEMRWRKEVDNRLETIAKNIDRLLTFARGNTFRLNKLLAGGASSTAKPGRSVKASTVKSKSRSTAKKFRRKTSAGPSQSPMSTVTRKYFILGRKSAKSLGTTTNSNIQYTSPASKDFRRDAAASIKYMSPSVKSSGSNAFLKNKYTLKPVKSSGIGVSANIEYTSSTVKSSGSDVSANIEYTSPTVKTSDNDVFANNGYTTPTDASSGSDVSPIIENTSLAAKTFSRDASANIQFKFISPSGKSYSHGMSYSTITPAVSNRMHTKNSRSMPTSPVSFLGRWRSFQ
ncbi:hypothetical protein PoB_003200800 [Plakobranchus ocellatus]|uniref:Ig-like domain-containing protein n=1 Tax=Plakobranchus ocellatus TaxID=259542 RepID=A0AAV4AG27_9GAST|nr:hypothetical protein PoB_003200800 [Plakobranchus ocellatus]